MKGLSQTLYLIVAAIIILIVALVLLTMFGGTMQHVGSFAQAKSICEQEASFTCKTTGTLPSSWSIITLDVAGEQVSCATIPGVRQSCSEY
ncbi:MAG: hypothetical protein ABIF08_00555 [Nanoarchaeota archaeon]